jgi:hypothetical protein
MKRLNKLAAVVTAVLLSLPSIAASQQPAPAPAAPPTQPVQPLEYAVKFVCGRVLPGAVGVLDVAPGNYLTLINVHNPNRPQEFTHKVALARLGGAGPMTGFQPYIVLPYDAALDFNCRWIASRLSAAGIAVPAFYTGFLVIQSRYELDVVAVYTAAPTNTQQVATMHTERVAVRRVQ